MSIIRSPHRYISDAKIDFLIHAVNKHYILSIHMLVHNVGTLPAMINIVSMN